MVPLTGGGEKMGSESKWYEKYLSQLQMLLEAGVVSESELKEFVGRHSMSTDTTAPDEGAKETEGGVATPTITVGDRRYEVLSFLWDGEDSASASRLADRAKEMSANLGEGECLHFLNCQWDIPKELLEEVDFVFTDSHPPDGSNRVAIVFWNGNQLVRNWAWFVRERLGRLRVLRRKFK